jgi:hypothetical protein
VISMINPAFLTFAMISAWTGPPPGTTVAVCGGGGLMGGPAGRAIEGCLVEDQEGAGVSLTHKGTLGTAYSADVSLGIKISQGTVEDAAGTGAWAAVPLRGPLSVEGARSSDGKLSIGFSQVLGGRSFGGGPTGGVEVSESKRFRDMAGWSDLSYFKDAPLIGQPR